jgi:biopolymer transport protein ExbD
MTRQPPHATSPGVELPITPMLDMTFQLLVFFIITYHPSALEGKMDFSLPTPKGSALETPPSGPEEPGELSTPNPVTVVARTEIGGTNAGGLSALLVQTATGEAIVNDSDGLRTYLQRLRKTEPAPGEVWLQVEGGLKYALVVRLMDSCKQAGFSRISFVSSRAGSTD